MSHASHDSSDHDAAHHDGPPSLPQVTDEAGNSPTWLPFTGLALLALIALVTIFRMQSKDEIPAAAEAPAADVAAEAADDDEPQH